MNPRLFFFLLFLTSCTSQSGQNKTVLEAIAGWFEWLFFDVSAARWDSSEFLVLTRLLLFLIVFALIYAALMFVEAQNDSPLKGQKRAIILISLVLALLAVIIVPAALLVSIMVSYGGLFSAVLILIPLILVGTFLWKTKEAEWLKALACLILFYTYGAYANTAFVLRRGPDADMVFAYIADFAGVASVVFLFLFFYYIFETFGRTEPGKRPFSLDAMKRFFGASNAQGLVAHVGTRLAAFELAAKANDLDALKRVASEEPQISASLNNVLALVVKDITELDVQNQPAAPGFDPAKVHTALEAQKTELNNQIGLVVSGWEDVDTDALAAPTPPTPQWWRATSKKVFKIRTHFDKLKTHLTMAENLMNRVP